jgi:peptide/nickel transport system substrate-binding protein
MVTVAVAAVRVAFGASANEAAFAAAAPSGGSLVSTIRSDPRTFNRFVDRAFAVDVLNLLTQARLVRINRVTMALEPMLAESWTRSADNLTYTLKLRKGVKFSDDAPFTAADVLFSLRAADCLLARCAADDTDNGSVLRIRVQNKPLAVAAIDDYTVSIRFPSPFGPGLRVLDGIPIYPRHLLDGSLNDGSFAKAWPATTPPAKLAGLGPFVLREYQSGQRLVFERNPNYWRKDTSGRQLPYLDRLTLEIVGDQNAELLRLQSGEIDCIGSEIRLEDYATLKQAAAAGKVRLADLGVGLDADSMWFNLRKDAKIAPGRRAWLQSAELRRAIAESVDRKRLGDIVFLGAAAPVYGPISPGNKVWSDPAVPKAAFDRKRAAARLADLGFKTRNREGVLVDGSGQPLRFTLVTRQGNSALERGAACIRDDLRAVGIAVDVVPLEGSTLNGRLEKGDYEAIYFRFLADPDPALNPDFWLSSGSAHVWNPSQDAPATDWERRLDELFGKQAATVDERERRALVGQMQRILADELPLLYFAAPRVYVVTSSRVVNATPSLMRPVVLWSADTLAVQAGRKGTN